jgi:hypothetical protein
MTSQRIGRPAKAHRLSVDTLADPLAPIEVVQLEGRPIDACSIDLQRHLVAALLLWIERWYDAAQIEQPDPNAAAVRLHRRFARVLERDFARHHDASHYADALAVPGSRRLTHASATACHSMIGPPAQSFVA